jgi:predicted permease
MDTLLQDIRYAIRQIARAPAFTTIVVVLLALGIGTNAGIFTVLHAVDGRPAPGVEESEDLVRIVPTFTADREKRPVYGGRVRLSELGEYRQQREIFSSVAGWLATPVRIDLGDGPTEGLATLATGDYFPTLRLRMTLGSGLPPTGDSLSAETAVAVISHAFWRRHFNAAPDVLGRQITINELRFTVIGVAPERFTGLEISRSPTAVWVPFAYQAALSARGNDGWTFYQHPDSIRVPLIARLAPNVTRERADAVVSTLAPRLADRTPPVQGVRSLSAEVTTPTAAGPASDTNDPQVIAAFALIGVFVLLITCTNVSNLLIGRALSRQHEVGVRLSLGASRGRVIRQLLTESTVLAILGAASGMLLFYWLVELGGSLIFPVLPDLRPDWMILVVTISVSVGSGIAFGLAPALHASRGSVAGALRVGAGGHSRRGSRLQGGFVVFQLALTIPVLAVGAALVGSLIAGMYRRLGYEESANVALGTIRFDGAKHTARQANVIGAAILRRIASMTGVTAVASASHLPPGMPDGGGWMFTRDGTRLPPTRFKRPDDPDGILENADFERYFVHVGPGYFDVLGVPIVRGRSIDSTDAQGSTRVAVVGEDFGKAVWPGGDPLGKTLVRGSTIDTTYIVVGIAGAIASDEGPAPTVYLARSQRPDSIVDEQGTMVSAAGRQSIIGVNFVVRTDGPVEQLEVAIGALARELGSGITVPMMSLAERREARASSAIDTAMFALGCGAVLLLLSSIGIYSIVAFGVAQRTREIGIRMALGARTGQVVAVFIRQGVKLGIIALVIGLPIGIALATTMADMGTNIENVASTLLMALILLAVAALASWLPARRAARVDPVSALRAE